ncbi:hypothetical protein Ait01nite_085040 [Actinoplanes italicus]|uniref:FG-GAP repeat domain-containing protein n=1 Tax=Actinoplanes italicus TaxID=113567 RepID=UPI001A37E544|nr:VCBS repeat-containing protein [Actinoplanes italicus]GIE35459.1 hypothetical protein Ait01nite_085040 [Actinoplanes italicus]
MSLATIAAAVLYPAAAAQAAPPVFTARAAAAPVAPCGNGAVTAADKAIADRLRPAMNGPRLGSAVSGRSIACARVIVGTVQARGLGPRAAVIAVTTAIAESTLNNHAVAHDHDSLGLFQQRPSQGWGRPAQLTNVEYATNAFLSSMLRNHPGDGWMTGDIGAICQRVQRSAYPGAYSPEVHDADLIVAQLWGRSAPAPIPAAGSATPATPATPSGPYQKALITAGTELGDLAGRNDLLLADWNADKHPDLMLVRGSGSPTGRAEVRIMDGASNFAGLLLTTSTAIAATENPQTYAVTDWNGDNRPDLLVVRKSGSAGSATEVVVLDGASSFRQALAEIGTALAATDDRHHFAVADWNGDARPDLVVTQTSGTASGKMEVQVLDGASNFQRLLAPVIVTAEPGNTAHRVAVTDYNDDRRVDLVVIQKSLTATGKTQLRILDGAANLQRQQARTDTAPGVSGHLDMLITEWNGDRRPDLMMVQKTGTASGRTELVVLGG